MGVVVKVDTLTKQTMSTCSVSIKVKVPLSALDSCNEIVRPAYIS